MDTRRILGLAGGTTAFVAAVAIGAFAIVALSPREKRPPLGAQQALLIETATAEKPFDAPPAARVLPSAPVTAEPAPLWEVQSAPRSKPPQVATLEATPRSPLPVPGIKRGDGSAKVDLRPPRPPEAPAVAAVPKVQPHADGLLTPGEIRRMRLSLRLTRDQEPYWPAVEQALLELGAQQDAMVRAGQDPKDAFGVGAGMRIYSAAKPLLDVLREDQKAQVRARARTLGFSAIASSI